MYTSGTYIIDPIGNNEFSYTERIALGSMGKIFVPSLIKGSVDDLEQGSEIVFEEVENGKLISCSGLKHFVQTDYEGIPVYIVDNHNHALSFRNKTKTLIHIDQHADTKSVINESINVGNFITAAVNNGTVNEVIQIRSDYALHHLDTSVLQQGSSIVDIDVDFWEDKVITSKEIQIIRDLIKKAKLVTIATSPYFMDQERAIEIIHMFLK